MVRLSPDTSIHDLLEAYPFLEDFLIDFNSRFSLLTNPVLRATAARVATLRTVSDIGGVELDELMGAIQEELGRRRSPPSTPTPDPPKVDGDSQKVDELRSIILDLHDGVAPDVARTRFNRVVTDVSPEEIGAMEEQLIREGMPVEEIQRLCDLHVSLVQDSLDRQDSVSAPSGHPIHTYLTENEIITELANRLGALCADARRDGFSGPGWSTELSEILNELSGIDNHYLRKENELFPYLERHGITGPSQVMWGVHDEIRGRAREAREHLERGSWESAARAGRALARSAVEMVYKEDKILLPLAQETLAPEEWEAIRRGEDELGYAFHEPAVPFPMSGSPGARTPPPEDAPLSGGQTTPSGKPLPTLPATDSTPRPPNPDDAFIDLATGRLSVTQLDLLLRHLPVEISFVDADGFVRYYSETEDRLFPRTPGAIGRHVENCHPPKSIHMVQEILQKFASGERDVAEFWIEMQGKFIHIRYFAVRNEVKEYLGCLEVTQDVTGIRALEGQRRLLEWR